VKFNHTGADGSSTSGTQVLTKIDDSTIQVQTVGNEVDGEMIPTRSAIKNGEEDCCQ